MPEIPVAVPPHRTVGAARVPCLAKGPPMGDDREMPRLPFFRRGPSFEGSPNRFVVLAAGGGPPPRGGGGGGGGGGGPGCPPPPWEPHPAAWGQPGEGEESV